MNSKQITRALLASFVLPVALFAQASPKPTQSSAAAAASSEEKDVLVLSPFAVSTDKDNGYQATDTMSGGLLAVNLLKSPSDVTVLTRDFLSDIAATTMEDASAWLTGSLPIQNITDQRDFGNGTQFRGLATGNNTRNYFRYDTSLEPYAMERVEGSRGPNAIQYGDSNAGGAVNIATKQAKYRNFGTALFKLDHRGSIYSSLDINRKVTDKLAARLNLFSSDTNAWFDGGKDKRYGAMLSATYKPWKKTSIRVELEESNAKRNDLRRFYDQTSRWDGTTLVTTPLASNPAAATGLSRFTTDMWVIMQGTQNLYNFRNYARTNGSALSVSAGTFDGRPDGATPFPRLPYVGYQLMPGEYGLEMNNSYYAVIIEQQLLKNLTLEVAADSNDLKREQFTWDLGGNNTIQTDVNSFLPDGTPNPNVRKSYVEGRYNHYLSNSTGKNYRIALGYNLETSRFKQLFSAVAMRRNTNFTPRDIQLGRTNGTDLNKRAAANAIWYRTYFDKPRPSVTDATSIGGVAIGESLNRDTNNTARLDSLVLATIGKYFDDKLTVVLGKRFDHSQTSVQDISTYDSMGNVSAYKWVYGDRKTDTLTGGITFFPIPSLGVYSNFSEGFLPINNENFWVGSRGAVNFTRSEVKSLGLRARLFDGALVGSVGYYAIDENDRLVGSAKTSINNIWNVLAQYDASKVNNLIGGPFTTFNDTQDYKATGYELDLTLNIANRFRLMANVSLPKTEQQNAFPDTIEYYNSKLPEWNAALANPAITAAEKTTIQTNINNVLNQTLAAADGRRINNSADYRINIFGIYSFRAEGLKGFALGGGVNMYGKNLIGNTNVSSFDYVLSDSYLLGSLVAKYAFKVRGVAMEAQLNVSNLFDHDEPIYQNVAVYNNVTYRNNYNYIAPRTFSLSLNARF